MSAVVPQLQVIRQSGFASKATDYSGFSPAPKARAQAWALDQAHWKLYPPSQPVISTTSPMKYKPFWVDSIVFCDKALVETPPTVTSAFL